MFVIPIERANPVRSIPWLVYSLIVVNAGVWVLTWWAEPRSDIAQRFGFIPAEHGTVSVFSSMFLHLGFWHIAGNMFFLWMFGDNVEDVLGSVLFLPSYLACGVAATGLLYVFDRDSAIPCIGASEAISGAVGMYMVFFPKVKVDLSFFFGYIEVATIKSPAFVAIGVWLGEQSLLGLGTWLAGVQGYVGIGFWAHVGGLLTGGALGLVYTWLGFPSRYFESIGGEIAEYMACPVCGKAGRQMPMGRYRCKTCHSRLSIDAEGEVHVVWSGKTAEQKEVDKLKATLVVGAIAAAAVIYAVMQWKR